MHIEAVKDFELLRYVGTWYEFARYPHHFEKDIRNASAVYTILESGKIEVENSGYKKNRYRAIKGIARFKGSKSIGLLRVSFFGPFYGDYKIIYLNNDYTLAIVTSSSMDYLWVLSKKRNLSNSSKKEILERVAGFGFDISRLEYPMDMD